MDIKQQWAAHTAQTRWTVPSPFRGRLTCPGLGAVCWGGGWLPVGVLEGWGWWTAPVWWENDCGATEEGENSRQGRLCIYKSINSHHLDIFSFTSISTHRRCPAVGLEVHLPVQRTGALLVDRGLVGGDPHLDLSFWLHLAALSTWAFEDGEKKGTRCYSAEWEIM